ncbi:MAG: type II toxin-antitoxin system PemK/MazF family toxin [Pseudoxanthomonas sp.]
MKRGEVWWANLPDPLGSGPGYKRPVLIVQSNAFNDSRIATAIVATLTSNLALAEAPGNVRVSRSDSGLPRPSVVNVSQIITLDRSILASKVRTLPGAVMDKVDSGLKLVFALS